MKAPEVHGPQDLPKLRLYLLWLWRQGGPMDNIPIEKEPFALPGQVHPPGRTWGQWERHQLANADLWWVSADMTDLTQAVSHSIPHETTPPDINIPSNSGLVVFEKPWVGVDSRNTEIQVAVSAVLWGQTRLGKLPGRKEDFVEAVSFSCYEYLPEWINLNSVSTPEDACLRFDQVRRYLDSGGHLDALTFNNKTFETDEEIQRVIKGIGALSEEEKQDIGHLKISGGSEWLPLGRSDWPVVDKLTDPITDLSLEGLSVDASFQEDRRMMSSFWTLVQTTRMSTVTNNRAPRPERRRYERAGHSPNLSDVRVVQLRKLERDAPETPVEGHKQVEWSCQWPVTAHACMQPYGPGRSLRKLIIRGPFLKGPPDKPLRVRQEVKAFVR